MTKIETSHNVLIIEPSTSGLEYLSNAKKLGLNVYVFSAEIDERIIPDQYRQYIDCLIKIDTNDLEAMSRRIKELLKKTSLDAVIPGFEIFASNAAKLACIAKVPSVSKSTADALCNKLLARQIMKNNNFKLPHFVEVSTFEDIVAKAKYFEFPAVLKPTTQSGSIHVSKVNNIDELKKAYLSMKNETWTEMGKGVGSQAIVESYVAGPEYSVEGVVSNDKVLILAVTEKILSAEPYFVEMGHIVPAAIDSYTKHLIEQYTQEVVHALGIHYGAFHCEIRFTEGGPVLIEIGARPAGDNICDLIELTTGINYYQQALRAYLNKPNIMYPPKHQYYAGICFFSNNREGGYLRAIKNVSHIESLPGFLKLKQIYPINTYIPPLTAFNGRAAYAIFKTTTYKKLKSVIYQAKNIISLE